MNPTHGLVTTYRYHRCRCELCSAAHAKKSAEERERRALRVQTEGLPPHVSHGASAYRNWGCRCDVCTTAHVERCRQAYLQRKARKVA